MIEQERRGTPGDPATKAERWLEEISEAGRKRARYQEMAAEWLIDFEELRTRLAPPSKILARQPRRSYSPWSIAQSTRHN